VTQLLAGLIGVVLGAVVSEALRARNEKARLARNLTGARRLLIEELGQAEVAVGEVFPPDAVRRMAKDGAITDGTWQAHKTLFAESLDVLEWMPLAAPYSTLRLLLLDGDDLADEQVEGLTGLLRRSIPPALKVLNRIEEEVSMSEPSGIRRIF
jgi:hypothetical protein